nr:MAG: replication initiator protein [Microviridae sp.]
MCLNPKLIKNKKYVANKKNGGQIPPLTDNRLLAVPVGCGECIECRRQKSRTWNIRLQEEIKSNKNGQMVTLTFNTQALQKLYTDEKINTKTAYERDNKVAKIAIRYFLERWRKKYKKSLRHWLITELGHGKTEHLHLHGIIWTDKTKEAIQERWQYGNVWAGYNNQRTYVNAQTVNYITKYVTKIDTQHKYYKPRILTSPGIGQKYTEKNDVEKARRDDAYTTTTGHKIALPIYYRNKIYTEQEREEKWIEQLNKQKRYVMKQEIDISINEIEYIKALKRARKLNERLGYGNGEIKWEEKKYEEERRNLIMKQRVEGI